MNDSFEENSGGRYSNCSVIEALNLVEKLTNIKIQKQIIKTHRVGDHIWYISNLSKFKKHYPKWKQKYNTKKKGYRLEIDKIQKPRQGCGPRFGAKANVI